MEGSVFIPPGAPSWCRLQFHRRRFLLRVLQADMDAGVIADAVGGLDVVVAVTFRLPQGLRGVALSQQFSVD